MRFPRVIIKLKSRQGRVQFVTAYNLVVANLRRQKANLQTGQALSSRSPRGPAI